MQEEPSKKTGKSKADATKHRTPGKPRRKGGADKGPRLQASAGAAPVEVAVVARCSDCPGAPVPPGTAALDEFWRDYQRSLRDQVAAHGWPVAASEGKDEKEEAIRRFHTEKVVPGMMHAPAFQFLGGPRRSRQTPTGWDYGANAAGMHWGVYNQDDVFVRHFGLDEEP
jgi:hypothetical protein